MTRIAALDELSQREGSVSASASEPSFVCNAAFNPAIVAGLMRFDASGYTTTDFTSTDSAYALMMQADGRFVAAGVSNSGDFAVARFDAAGALDTSFNSTGKVTADFAFGADAAYALAIGPDYKIVVAGTGGPYGDFAAARFKVAGGLEERLYVLSDRNFNVTAVTDVFGVVKERFVYDPYGKAITLNVSFAVGYDVYSWVTLFQGKRYDSLSNLYYYNFREYSPTLGRFTTVDPSGYPDGVNRYQMEGGNPTVFVDPMGLQVPTTQPTPSSGTTKPGGPTTKPTTPAAPVRPGPTGGIYPPPPAQPGKFFNGWNSVVCNESARPVLVWNWDSKTNRGGYGILKPGQSTPANQDSGDWVQYNGKWYKVGANTCHVDDKEPPYVLNYAGSGPGGGPPQIWHDGLPPGPDKGGFQPGPPPWVPPPNLR